MTVPNDQHKPVSLNMWLHDWLEDLQDLGVDLADFGSKEIDLKRRGFVAWRWRAREWSETTRPSKRKYIWTLRFLEYGPSPSDWELTLDRVSDPKALLSRNIPGGWVVEDAD